MFLETLLNDISIEMVFVGVFIMLLLTLAVYVFYSGMCSSITVSTSEPEYGPITLAYKTMTGPYKNVGEIFTESFCLLPDRKQLGIYYDDPEGTPPDHLRSAVGPILASGDEKPLPEEMEKMVKNGFKIVHLPKPSYVVTAAFPFTTTLSIFLAIYRVYPRLRDYIANKNLCAYPALEVYTDSSIIFMMPLSRQDEFFVSEFQEEEMSIATTDVESTIDTPVVRDQAGFVIPQPPEKKVSRKSVDSKAECPSSDEDKLSDDENSEEPLCIASVGEDTDTESITREG